MIKRILMIAQPWGFGPVGSLMNCRARLQDVAAEWWYLGPEYTAGLVDPGLFAGQIYLRRGDAFAGPELERAIRWADVVVSGTEFRVADALRRWPRQLVVVDPLFWFWPSVPPIQVDKMVYLCQNFPGVVERVQGLPAALRLCFHVVAPAIPAPPPRKQTTPGNHLVVNLGGAVNPFVPASVYPELVIDALREALPGTRWRQVTVTGNPAVLEALERQGQRSGLTFRCFRYSEMLHCLASADLLLTAPGLNATLEAMSLGVPVTFLPAQNGSQAAQLDRFQQAGLGMARMDWVALLDCTANWKTSDEASNNRRLEACAMACHASPTGRERLASALRQILQLKPLELDVLRARQDGFVRVLKAGEMVTSLEAVFERWVLA